MDDIIIPAKHALEVTDRLRRIETKLHKIALATGADTDPATTVTIEDQPDRIVAYVPGYDITFAQVRRALEQARVAFLGRTIFLVSAHNGSTMLGTLRLTDRK